MISGVYKASFPFGSGVFLRRKGKTMKPSRKESHAQETASKGAFCTLWGQKWGLSIYPAYGIDKVKFSFIEIGSAGKGKSFDVYIDTIRDGAACFDNWAEDIELGVMWRVLKAEKDAGEKYPKEYKFQTGENAEKSLGITNAQNGGYLFNASTLGEDGKKVFANIQCNRGDLIRLAKRFKQTYEARLTELNQIMLKAASDYKKQDARAMETESNAPTPAPVPETTASETPAPEPKAEAKQETKKAEQKAETKTVEVKSLTPLTLMKNEKDLCMQVITKDNLKKNVIFRTSDTSRLDPDLWKKFRKRTEVEGCKFKGVFEEMPKGTWKFLGFPA